MASVTLQIEFNEANAGNPKQLDAGVLNVTLSTSDNIEKNSRIIEERTRTIEQIKRLYAVVMGFSLTGCIANAYLCSQTLDANAWASQWTLFAEVFTFVSTISLFYLGAERFLDRKYLQPTSSVPHPIELWFDLLSLGIIAAWFVILANTIPSHVSKDLPIQIQKSLDTFMANLVILYTLDILLLAIQALHLFDKKSFFKGAHWQILMHPLKNRDNPLAAMCIWILINTASIGFLLGVIPRNANSVPPPLQDIAVLTTAGLLFFLHFVRFWFDFGLTFRFYYPAADLDSKREA